MALTSAQIKGRIKNVAKKNNADARSLMRLYAMERFLDRLSHSKYRDNFIIKGGILVTAMVGVAHRSTMDIDASIRNTNLSAADAEKIVAEIKDIDLEDGMTFFLREVENIMDEMEYPGIRIQLEARMEKMVIPLKIDISTGDVITPRAVEFEFPLMLEDRTIPVWSYNLETVLGEKLQTILARGILNTRMRDYYDVYILLKTYGDRIDATVFGRAFLSTCNKRETPQLYGQAETVLEIIESNGRLRQLWESYQRKYPYAGGVRFKDTMQSVRTLVEMVRAC